jgi:hypothetical protein
MMCAHRAVGSSEPEATPNPPSRKATARQAPKKASKAQLKIRRLMERYEFEMALPHIRFRQSALPLPPFRDTAALAVIPFR